MPIAPATMRLEKNAALPMREWVVVSAITSTHSASHKPSSG